MSIFFLVIMGIRSSRLVPLILIVRDEAPHAPPRQTLALQAHGSVITICHRPLPRWNFVLPDVLHVYLCVH